mmetsp:Transcript_26857/g.54821  ORF Transcript_26857/g.54821 Transcript_26857/m.54821 type:complete len:442 (-) Transcript_26857:737-2062(-)
MTIRQKIQTAILRTTIYATSTLALLEYTTQIPSEGRSSRTYHKLFDQIITPLGRRIFGPEEAHHLSLEVVRRGLAPRAKKGLDAGVDRTGHVVDMEVEIGLRRSGTNESGGNGNSNKSIESSKSTTSSKIIFRSPIGLAAGYDKNGIAIPGLFDLGFSFVEIGSVTPLPQPGNPKPRSFRLVEDKGVINRFGFNSEGVEKVKEYLEEYRKEFGGARPDSLEMTESSATDNDEDLAVGVSHSANSVLWALGWAWHRIMGKQPKTGVLGVNLGKNKLSNDEIGDYTTGICELGPYADYLVINVSSPNTPGLRSLQKRQPLQNLLSSTLRARDRYAPDTPLFVKLSPDLSRRNVRRRPSGIGNRNRRHDRLEYDQCPSIRTSVEVQSRIRWIVRSTHQRRFDGMHTDDVSTDGRCHSHYWSGRCGLGERCLGETQSRCVSDSGV